MAFTGKSLADGFVASSQGALYTVPAVTTAYLSSLSLFCDTATPQTVQLYLKQSGGTARKWRRYVFNQQYDHAEVFENGARLVLQAGDTVEAVTTTASVVAYFITGVEET
jgi:hypothetical protein